MNIQMQAYEVVEKIATQYLTTSRILVPRYLIDKKVRVVPP